MESLFANILRLIANVIGGLHIAQEVAIWIGHWVGRFIVAAIFLSAVTAIGYELSVSFGVPIFLESHWAYKVIGIFGNQKAWVAATAVVATTVAMGHFRALDINIEKAEAENEERRAKKREADSKNA